MLELASVVHKIATRLEQLERAHAALLKRFNALHPEPSHCPKCHAVVHPKAKTCSCGAKWGKEEDLKVGLPE